MNEMFRVIIGIAVNAWLTLLCVGFMLTAAWFCSHAPWPLSWLFPAAFITIGCFVIYLIWED